VEETGPLVMLPEYQKLYEENSDMIGWLKIEDTNIDYPVMQTMDDEEGTIPSTNLIIYGHTVKTGQMFGDEFITLSCCAYHVEDGRFVVVGKRIK